MAVCLTSPECPSIAPASQQLTTRPRSAPGELVLRVHGQSGEPQTIRIRSAKCTVGSAPGCTLRLRSPAIDPLCCWILRGAAGTVVQRLRGAALLNGRPLAESAVHAGDRLKVGPVELEVVECDEPVRSEKPLFEPPPAAAGELAQLRAHVGSLEEKSKRLEAEARQGFESSIMAAERADQLRDALAVAHEQLEETCRDMAAAQSTLQTQVEELESNQRQLNELHAHQRSLEERLDQATQQVQAAAAERDAAVADLEQVKAALSAAREAGSGQDQALEAQRTQFAQERSSLEQELTQLQRRLSQRDAEIDALRSSSAAQTGAMTVAMSELSESHQTLKEQLSDRCTALEGQLAECQAQLAGKERELAELHSALDAQSAAQNRLAELERAYEEKCAVLAAHQNEIDALKSAAVAASASSDLEAREQSLAGQQTELAQRETTLACARQELEAREASLTTERDEFSKLREQLDDERNELLLQRHELTELREQLSGRELQLAEHEARLAALSTQNESQAEQQLLAAQQAAELQAQAAARAAELQAQLAACSERLAELASLQEACLDQRAALAAREQDLQRRLGDLTACESALNEQAKNFAERLPPATVQEPAEETSAAEGANIEVPQVSAGLVAGDEASMDRPPVNVTAAWSPTGFAALVDQYAQGDQTNAPVQSEPAASAPAQPEAEPPAENVRESGDVDAVLGRLVRAGLWRTDGEPQAEDPAPAVQQPAAELPMRSGTDDLPEPPQPPSPADQSARAGASSDETDEESIESYMERLMKRVRGDAPAIKAEWKPAVAPAISDPEPVASQIPASPEPEAPATAAEYSPRRTAPELGQNISAMRELANTAARSAIDEHVRQHTVRQAFGKLIGACTTVTASLVLGYWAYRVQSLPATVAAIMGGGVGSYWTWAALRRLRALKRLNQVQGKAKEAAADQPLPLSGA